MHNNTSLSAGFAAGFGTQNITTKVVVDDELSVLRSAARARGALALAGAMLASAAARRLTRSHQKLVSGSWGSR